MRVFERFDGGVVLLDGVAVGAGGSRLIDGGLCLLDFFIGRVAATRNGREEQHYKGDEERSTQRHHSKVYAFLSSCSTMKDLTSGGRPREKLLRNGPIALGDNELIALVLGS